MVAYLFAFIDIGLRVLWLVVACRLGIIIVLALRHGVFGYRGGEVRRASAPIAYAALVAFASAISFLCLWAALRPPWPWLA